MEKEHYENIVSLLKQTLKFYSNENNYYAEGDSTPPINLDNGEQAENTLKIVKQLEDSIESYENDYEKYVKDTENNIDSTEEANNIINKLKNLK